MISALLMLLFAIPSTIFQGFVLSQLWLWFFVPLGVPSIGVANAIGITLLVSFLTAKLNMATDPEIKGWTLMIAQSFGCLMVWGFGALIHLFM